MPLSIGDSAPNFTAKDTSGNTVSLSSYAGKPVVIYFYPKDDTPGCTKQACSFRDNYAQYLSKGIAVFGVSMDDQLSHQKFTEKYGLPFPLLVDSDGALTKVFDVDGGGRSKRVTYLIDSSGKIEQVYTTVNTETHATDILADVVS